MKVSIRLQNHGCANHPYWWIVVAPNRKNIKGRFLEHVGYWAPREGGNVHRQITLNIPRIKYWIGNGAVPTPRIQTFLSYWNIMPKPFYVQSTKPTKPQQQMTDKQKRKEQLKQKKKERQKLAPINYRKALAKYKASHTVPWLRHKNKLQQKIYAAERENQILRELLLHHQFIKVNRINQLSGKGAVLDDTKQLIRLQGELKKAKTELALLEKNMTDSSTMKKIHAIKEINSLVDKIRQAELQRQPFRNRDVSVIQGQNPTKQQLDRQLQYQLVTKKIEKMNKEMQILQQLQQVVTLQEYANYLSNQFPDIPHQDILTQAEQTFIERGQKNYPPLTKFDLYFDEQISNDPEFQIDLNQHIPNHILFRKSRNYTNYQSQQAEQGQVEEGVEGEQAQEGEEREQGQEGGQQEQSGLRLQQLWKNREKVLSGQVKTNMSQDDLWLQKVHQQHLLKFIMTRPDVIVPTNRPVHPFPDLQTYIPQEYYEPISDLNLKVVHLDSLQPNDQLQKYKKKKKYEDNKSSKGLKEHPRKMSKNIQNI